MQSEEYTKRALSINPDSSNAICLLGQIRLFRGTIREAAPYFLKSITIDPNNPDALLWMISCYGLYFGKPKFVENFGHILLEIDPLSPVNFWMPGVIYWAEGKFELALELSFKYLKAEPDGLLSKWYYAQMLAWNNQLDNAYILMDQLIKYAPDHIFGSTISFLKFALQGEKEKALASMTDNELKLAWNDFHLPWFMAECYALINEKDEALKWLEHEIERGFINFPLISKLDPFLENIRNEDRFKKLLEHVKYEWENLKL
jgi:tetratricopeptide (TPR) repeat protein